MAYNRIIRSDDPQAINLLKENLESLESRREYMQSVNDYYRENGTMHGFEGMEDARAAELDANVEAYEQEAPYSGKFFNNNYREISDTKNNIYRLENKPDTMLKGWQFDTLSAFASQKSVSDSPPFLAARGEAIANLANNRLQLDFSEKPTDAQREVLKKNGFRWAPSAKVWQKPLDRKAMVAADKIDFIKPINGRSVMDLQPQLKQKNAPER